MAFYVLPKHLEDIGAGPGDVGRIMSLWGWAAIFIIPFLGHWLDRIGRRPFALGGSLLMAVSAAGLAGTSEVNWEVYLHRCLLGTGFIVTYTSAVAIQADMTPSRHLPVVFMITGVWALMTHLAGPVISEWIYTGYGFRWVGWLGVATAVISFVIFLRIPELPRPPRTGKHPPMHDIFRFMRERGIVPVLVFNLVEVATYTAVATFILVFSRSRGLASGQAFFIAYPVVAIILRLMAGRAQDRFGTHRVIYGSMVFYVGSIALMPLMRETWQLFLLGSAFGAGVTYVNPLLNALAISRARDAAYAGRITAWFIWAWCVGGVLAPLVFGFIAGRWGYEAMFLSVAVMLLGGNLIFAWNERRVEKAPSA